MYTVMKPVLPGGEFNMGGAGSESGPMGSMGGVLNGDGLDGMKNSPANGNSGGNAGPGTPRDDSGSGMGDYGNLSGFGGSAGENVSRLDFDF
jgi:hypothetical protein